MYISVYFLVASYPGVPIPIWRRGEEECLVHTVVRMCLILNQLLRKRHKMTISSMLVRCLLDMTVSSINHTITLKIHEEGKVWWQILLPDLLVAIWTHLAGGTIGTDTSCWWNNRYGVSFSLFR